MRKEKAGFRAGLFAVKYRGRPDSRGPTTSGMEGLSLSQLHPVVEPQELHFRQVPFRTRVN